LKWRPLEKQGKVQSVKLHRRTGFDLLNAQTGPIENFENDHIRVTLE